MIFDCIKGILWYSIVLRGSFDILLHFLNVKVPHSIWCLNIDATSWGGRAGACSRKRLKSRRTKKTDAHALTGQPFSVGELFASSFLLKCLKTLKTIFAVFVVLKMPNLKAPLSGQRPIRQCASMIQNRKFSYFTRWLKTFELSVVN